MTEKSDSAGGNGSPSENKAATPGPPPEVQWYIARDGQQHGPLTEAEMRLFVEGGHLKPTDLLWRPGFSDWRPAPQIFPPKPAPPPAPPPPAPPIATGAPQPRVGLSGTSGTSGPERQADVQTKAPGDAARRAPGAATPQPNYDVSRMAAAANDVRTEPRGQPTSYGQPRSERTYGADPRTGGGPAGVGGPAGGAPARAAAAAPSSSGDPGARRGTSAEAATSSSRAMVPARQDDFEYRPEKPRRSVGKFAALALLLVAVIAGGGWFAMQNKQAILDLLNSGKSADGSVPVVKAERDGTLVAPAKVRPSTPPAAASPPVQAVANDPSMVAAAPQPQPDTAAVDAKLQQRRLWAFMKSQFPDWYNARIKEAAVMVAAARPELEVNKHLIEALVSYRRKNADLALKASTAKHRAIAGAFLDNLQHLSSRGPDICYAFISQGETSSVIVDLMNGADASNTLERQAVTIFEAVAEGGSTPVTHERPKKEDYDVLAGQLGKLGWSQADLQMFADPKALSAATPARVCQMVRDWFKAHVDITDASVQERLLFETLRPVVGG